MVMITDPVGDLLARIRNVASTGKREVVMPYSRFRENILHVLEKEGYIKDVKKEKDKLLASLVFVRRQPKITGLKNISKPGLRIYKEQDKLPKVLGGAGIVIISTPKGVMSDKEARKKGLGGEVLAEVW